MSPGRPRKSGVRLTIRLDKDNYEALPRDKTDKRNQVINAAVRFFLKKVPISAPQNLTKPLK